MLGYTHEHLIALIVMLGSASTVSCFVMAKKYGTRRHVDIQRRCFDNIVFCVDDDWMAVYFPDNGTGVMED